MIKIFNLFLFMFFIFLLSCSSTRKTPYLSKKMPSADEINISIKGIKPFEISDCAVGIIIFPVNPLINFDTEIENKCGKEWEIFDLEQKESKFVIPIIYGQYCRTVRGQCRK